MTELRHLKSICNEEKGNKHQFIIKPNLLILFNIFSIKGLEERIKS